jgi:hypothetical protein
MSTLADIQKAIDGLQADERQALRAWLDSQDALNLSVQDEDELLQSLDAAARDLDSGKGVPIDEARKLVSSWAGK